LSTVKSYRDGAEDAVCQEIPVGKEISISTEKREDNLKSTTSPCIYLSLHLDAKRASKAMVAIHSCFPNS
jgi:hypothetical protein